MNPKARMNQMLTQSLLQPAYAAAMMHTDENMLSALKNKV